MQEPFPFDLTPVTDDEHFMLLALEQAWQAFCLGEVPVGAIIVAGNQVIAAAHNNVEASCNAMSHAEANALTLAAHHSGNWRLAGMTLYSTLEPCSMCAGAMILSRLTRVVWGAPDLRHGAHGSWIDVLGRPHPIHTVAASSGIYATYSSLLMRRFFQQRRQAKRELRHLHG